MKKLVLFFSACLMATTMQAAATTVEPATSVYLTLPYSEGFEAAGNALLPEGWTVITDREWNLQRYSLGNQHGGSWYLSFNYGNPAKYAVLPLYPDSLSLLTISLWHKTRDYYGSGQLTVGVMSDPADASTFRTIRVLPCTATAQNVTGVYRQATVDLATAPADCHYIALRYAGGNGGQDDMLYVDDIEVFLTPVTPDPDPVDPDPVDPDPGTDPVNPDPGTDPGSDPGSNPIPVGNGLFFDFEDASADTLWHYLHPDVNRWIIGNDMLDADRQYTRALYISNDGTYFDYNYRLAQVAWAWTAVSVDTDTLYSISFDYNCYGEYNTDYFLLMLVADSFGLPAAPNSAYYAGLDMNVSYAACHEYMPAGTTLLTDFMPTGSNEWRTHTCRRWLYPGSYYLVAFWTNDNDYGVFPAALDNIRIGREGQTQPDPGHDSALSDTQALSLPLKILRDGRLLIIRDGRTYDVLGREHH